MYRVPAEWEPQGFIQVTFPHLQSDWIHNLHDASACYVQIIETIARYQDILVVCDDIQRVKCYFNNRQNIHFTEIPTNDTWVRDYGAITIIEGNGDTILLDFQFNGWGQKYTANLDNEVNQVLYHRGIIRSATYKKIDLVLEGGSIESNGDGTILTTSECLLSEFRNEQLSKQDIEEKLKNVFGAHSILWLDHGHLAGDDTDGHIDTLCRFVDIDKIAYVKCPDPSDDHFESLSLMENQLKTFRKSNGMPYGLIPLPMADACYNNEGDRLPATYANFLIINNAVLLPIYGVTSDTDAIQTLKQCFPNREIIPINCRSLIEQYGSLHCATMQYPRQVKMDKTKLE